MKLFIYVLIGIFLIMSFWKVFEKAGEAGWKSIVPFYNLYILIKLAGRPGWWLILMFIPVVGFIMWLITCVDLAKNFGKSALFGVGLFFLSFIFYPILAFDDSTYSPITKL